MESLKILKETLDYVRQFQGKIIVVKVSKIVLANKKKLTNVIRDIILLKNAGIEIVVTHSSTKFVRDSWLSLEPVVFLNISTVADIKGQMAIGVMPIVFFEENPLLSSEKAIASLAIKLGAVKIIYITNCDGIFQSGKFLIHEMDVEQARDMLNVPGAITHEMRRRVEVALMACAQGIPRTHIIGSREGSLVKEILTSDGLGTMIYENMYKEIRKAQKVDVAEIFEIVRESVKKISITLDFVEKNIKNFWVFAVDQQIYGCMSMEESIDKSLVEVAYLGIFTAYEDPLIFERLIRHALRIIPSESKCIFMDPGKNTNLLGMYPWFKKLGFVKCTLRECGIANSKSNKMWIRKNIQ